MVKGQKIFFKNFFQKLFKVTNNSTISSKKWVFETLFAWLPFKLFVEYGSFLSEDVQQISAGWKVE